MPMKAFRSQPAQRGVQQGINSDKFGCNLSNILNLHLEFKRSITSGIRLCARISRNPGFIGFYEARFPELSTGLPFNKRVVINVDGLLKTIYAAGKGKMGKGARHLATTLIRAKLGEQGAGRVDGVASRLGTVPASATRQDVERIRFQYWEDVFNRTNLGGVNDGIGNANFGRPTGPRIITMGLQPSF